MFKHILVPIDHSALSLKALKYAAGLAKGTRTRITAVHVIPPFSPPVYMDAIVPYPELYSPTEYRKSTELATRKLLARAESACKAAGASMEGAFVTGDPPWEAIIRAARRRKCDLIVMASHGRRGLSAVVLGSETTRVLTHSKIPVLVCR